MGEKKQSGIGIAAFVLSLLGCGSFIGIPLGIISLATSKRNNTKRGLPIAAIIIGCVWLFVSFVLFLVVFGFDEYSISEKYKNVPEIEFKSSCKNIEYKELFRNNEKYSGEKVKFKGEIQQVVYDGDTKGQYLISVTKDEFGFWSDNIYVTLEKTENDAKFIENDIVEFYGLCNGTYSYTSILGEGIEVPQVSALYMDLEK